MKIVANRSIKINRAVALSDVGRYPETCSAMLTAIPASLISRITAADLAQILDALWIVSRQSKDIAAHDIIAEGAIWDSANNRLREIAA